MRGGDKMRIAVPVTGDEVCAELGGCETIRLFEDDHGRIVRHSDTMVEGGGADAVLHALERCGADILLCASLTQEQRRALAENGLLFSEGAFGSAAAAVRVYLGAAIACDPNNNCNYCGHKTECDTAHGA